MRIVIETTVKMNYQKVFEGFDERLFLALKPPLLPLTLRQFDGCKTGDSVKITLGAGWLKQDWDAQIIAQASTAEEVYFVDEGVRLPFFLKTWQHRHRIINLGEGSKIIDDITYTTPLGKTMDILMYPAFYLQFAARKPVYQRIFGKK